MTNSPARPQVATSYAIGRVRWLAAIGMVGASIQLAGGVLETIDRALPDDPQFVARTAIIGVAYLLFLATLLGLEFSGAAGHRALSHVGLLVAAAGWILYSAAQFVLSTNFLFAETVLFPTGTILIGVGMTLVGIAALRTRVWAGWRRYIVLLCGLFPFLAIFPIFALTGGPSFVVLSGWGACWLALGVAIWMGRSNR